MSSVNREGSVTSTTGKKKRERFARSRSGLPLPLSMHLGRFKFRESGKSTVSGISQSLDAGDISETNESFDEFRVKRTASAPTREGSLKVPVAPFLSSMSASASTSPSMNLIRPPTANTVETVTAKITTSEMVAKAFLRPADTESKGIRGGSVVVSAGGSGGGGGGPPSASSSYVCVQLEDDCDKEARGSGRKPVKPNGSSTPSASSSSSSVAMSDTKLKGIVQPLRTSTGWL